MAINLSHIEPEELAATVDMLLSGQTPAGNLPSTLSAIPGFIYGELRKSGRSVLSRWANEADLWKSLCKLLESISETAKTANELLLCFATNPRSVTIGNENSWQLVNANVNRGLVGYEFRLASNPSHFHRITPLAFVAQNRTYEKFLQEFAEQHGMTLEQAKAGAVIVREFDCEQYRIELQQPSEAQRLFRGNTLVPIDEIKHDSIKNLAQLLSEFLIRSVLPDGRMTYLYYPSRGSEDRTRDNSVRQWMATRALNAIWQRSKSDALTSVIRRNLDYNLKAMYREVESLGLIVEGDKVKLGALALAALALNESPFAQEFSKEYQRISATVRALWTDSGQFRTFYQPLGRTDNQNFYPGEALLFWSQRISAGDKSLIEPFWRSFDYYQRWHLANRNPAFIPWHTQAYWVLWKLTHDDRLSRAILEMNDWLLGVQQWETAPYPDCRGRFYDPHRPFGPPHASSTGVFLEGLADAFALAREVDDRARADRYRVAILRGLRSIAQLTFKDDGDMFYVAQRDRLRGGVRTCEYDNAVRIDNVQHCLMSIHKVLDAFSIEDFDISPDQSNQTAQAGLRIDHVPTLVSRDDGPLWTASELAAITKGHWYGSMPDVKGIAYRPDRVNQGDLFVALNYEGVDYHNHVAAAFARGAKAAMVSRRPTDVTPNAALLITPNVHQSLTRLGVAGRNRAQGKFIAVTGRAGKTFTKDTLAQLLAKQAPTQKTQGNDNDFTGVPITLARAQPNYTYQVLEVSMSHLGTDMANSVRPKAKLVRPHVAIITRVIGGRIEDDRYRKHQMEVAATKAQILEGLELGGTIILNRDDGYAFEFLRLQAEVQKVERVVTFGKHNEADVRLMNAVRRQNGIEIRCEHFGKPLTFVLGVHGSHLVLNSLAALAAIDAVGADVQQALAMLPEIHESPGRGNRYVIPVSGGTALLLDHTRNSAMPGVHAALHALAETELQPGGRRLAVLGEMTELDENPIPFHKDLALAIDQLGIDSVFSIGPMMKPMYDALPSAKRGGCAEDSDSLGKIVQTAARPGDVILVQGKRLQKMYRVVQMLVGDANFRAWE